MGGFYFINVSQLNALHLHLDSCGWIWVTIHMQFGRLDCITIAMQSEHVYICFYPYLDNISGLVLSKEPKYQKVSILTFWNNSSTHFQQYWYYSIAYLPSGRFTLIFANDNHRHLYRHVKNRSSIFLPFTENSVLGLYAVVWLPQ